MTVSTTRAPTTHVVDDVSEAADEAVVSRETATERNETVTGFSDLDHVTRGTSRLKRLVFTVFGRH